MHGRKVRITWTYFLLSTFYVILASLTYVYTHSYFSFIIIWPATCYFYMFVACLTNNPHMLGKNRKTGKIDKLVIIALLPLFIGIWTVWFLRKTLSSERVYDEIVPGIYVGLLNPNSVHK